MAIKERMILQCEEGSSSNIEVIVDKNDWLKVVSDNSEADLHQLSSKFGEKLKADKLNLAESEKQKISLLKDITSMMLTPNSNNEPFRPIFGSRSAIPSDLSSSEINTLSQIILKISHNELKARLCDVVWLCSKPRNPEHARIAIDCYIAGGIEPKGWYKQKKKEFERAYRLACLLKDTTRMAKVENLLKEAFYSDDNNFQEIMISTAQVIDKLNLLKDYLQDMAMRLENTGGKLAAEHDFKSAIQFFELSAKKYKQAKN